LAAVPVPLVDLEATKSRLKPRIDARLATALAHGRFVLGPEVAELEAELARRAGVAHAVGVANGTDALTIALRAEGIGPGDAVFLPAFSFVATAGAVVLAGATPVFCDVDPATFHLDPVDLERRAAALPASLRPRAVVPVDLFGLPADYGPIRAFAGRHGLLVLADAAQSFGAARDGRPVGALADATAVSFYPTKPLGAFGDGGAILTDDADRAARFRALRAHGANAAGVTERVGTNSRLDTLQAAVLLAKLESFDADLARRAGIAVRYDAAFAGHPGGQARPPGATSTHAVYVVRSDARDRIRAALSEEGIATRIYYEAPLHLLPALRHYGADEGSLPVSEDLCRGLLALPIYPELDDATVDRVADAVLRAAAGRARHGTPPPLTGSRR
jgi:dTDP-4-amino-4,6-dideoxygalactose transaminase